MSRFSLGLFNAGRHTVSALARGRPDTLHAMQQAQENRYKAFSQTITALNFTPKQLLARRQYWCTQLFFLAKLMTAHPNQFQDILKKPIRVETEADLRAVLADILLALDDRNNVAQFLSILSKDNEQIESAPVVPQDITTSTKETDIQFFCGDALVLINKLFAQGKKVITDIAPNSHRDGAAKYSAGSVEELFSRYTDQALKMALHFEDVHVRNMKDGCFAFKKETPPPVDLLDYQQRYFKMMLSIFIRLLDDKEAYLESQDFLKDLLTTFPNVKTKLPIYFDLQNNVYEVPTTGGFTATHWFMNSDKLTTVETVLTALRDESIQLTPLNLLSYAAPDLRRVETSPLDVRATSNTTLQDPSAPGRLEDMLTSGVALQCQQAIALAQHYKTQNINQPIAVVFIMPGCGAFNNPKKMTAAHFISAIQFYYPELEAHHISCHVVEYDRALMDIIEQSAGTYGAELGQLNIAISQIQDRFVYQKAIAVRKRILTLYAKEPDLMKQHLMSTAQLLLAEPGEQREAAVKAYKNTAATMKKSANPLWRALGISMMALGIAVLALGITLCCTGVYIVPAVTAVAGGVALLLSGIGAFATHRQKEHIDLANDLAKSISKLV